MPDTSSDPYHVETALAKEIEDERLRHLRLDRADHPDRERDRRVLHRRLVAWAHCEIAEPSVRASGDGRWLDHAVLRLCIVATRVHLGLRRRSFPAQIRR